MKKLYLSVGFALALISCNPAHSAIVWTNTAGGNWSDATSWDPNQVPTSSDDTFITADGTYTVTLNGGASVNTLVVGGTSGVQTFDLSSALTITSNATFNVHGSLNFNGGTLAGPTTVLQGTNTWSGGALQAGSALTVAANGLMLVTGSGGFTYGTLTNAGTIRLVDANLVLYGPGLMGLINLPGALVDMQSDVSLTYGYGSEVIMNQGTVRKSGGSGTSAIQPMLNNSGTVNAQTGTLSLTSGEGDGLFLAGAGATLAYTGTYTIDDGGLLTGAGTNLLAGGTFTLNGSITSSNAVLAAGYLGGTSGILGGSWIWAGGVINYSSTLTVATNGTVLVTGGGTYVYGTVTNAGTIRLVDANLVLYGPGLVGLVNLPGALVDIKSDVSITYGYGNEVIMNQGTVGKSGGSGESAIQPILNNSGTVNAQTGTLSLTSGEGDGLFLAGAGATLAYTGTYTIDDGGQLTGTGTNLISGTFTLNGNVTSADAVLAGGTLGGTNGILGGSWIWAGGAINYNSTLTVPTNGTVLVTGGGTFVYGTLTNAGTIRLVDANLAVYGSGLMGLVNLPGALVDIQSDVNLTYGYGSEVIINQGTVRKSGGSNGSVIQPILNNSGTVNAQAGTLSLTSGEGDGLYLAGAGATLAYTGTYTIDEGGQLTGAGTNLISGIFTLNGNVTSADAVLVGGSLGGTNGILGGNWIWAGGSIAANSTLTVPTNGTVLVTGGGTYISGTLTNAGTIRLVDANLPIYGNGLLGLVNLPGALVDIQSDVGIGYGYGNEAIVNQGTLRKSGGTNTTYIYPALYNSGTLDAQSGIINFPVANYDLTGGTLNFGLSSPTNYGTIYLSGSPATLIGTLSANLNNGYVPIRGDSFAVLNYASQIGSFDNFILPAREAWSTNYGATTFTLTVLNSAPTLPSQTNQVVNEETLLTVTNTATDLDLPPDTLSYTFLDAPSGAHLSASGVITWTPDETQGPSTNVFTTRVSDSGFPSLSATNSFTVIVNESNVPPVLAAITNTNINELAMLTVTNIATDHDSPANPLTFSLLSPLLGMAINATNGVFTWTPSEAQGPSTNTITVVVTDTNVFAVNAKSLSTTNTFSVVVNELNVAPVLTVPANPNISELATLTVTNTATDVDNPANPLTFSLISPLTGMAINATNGVFTWTPTEAQGPSTNTITVIVTDTNTFAVNARSLSTTNTFSVIVNELNVAPVLTVPANTNINELATLTVTNTATDADAPANTLAFSLVSPLTGMAINATNGVFTWAPTEAQGPSTNTITVVVTDTNTFAVNAKSLSTTNTFSVIVNEVNVAPVLTVPANTNINELATLTVTNTATDADVPANPLTFSLSSPLTGMAINATNGVFTWTPTEAQGPSTNTITVVVTDTNIFAVNTKSLSGTNTFTVVVNEMNVAPVLAALSDWNENPGQTVSFTATATDVDIPANTLTYSLVSPPSGATINSASGLFNWRPPVSLANTTNTVQVQVTDSNPFAVNSQHLSDTKSFKVVVNPLAPVVLTPAGLANGQFKFQVSGSAGPDYIITSSTNLSAWTDIFTNLSPTMPFQFTNAVTSTNRFFRARLAP